MTSTAGRTRPDQVLSFLRSGYLFASRVRRRTGVSPESGAPVSMNLLGKRSVLVRGEEGVDLFYDTSRMKRDGAMPLFIRGPLFGSGAVHALDGPVYLRVGKLPVPVVTDEDTPFEIGKAVRLREGDDVTLLTTGSMASETLGAADLLAAEGVKAEVLHLHTIKPLDAEAVIASVTKTGCAVTAEEHSVVGGLGSAVAEVLSEHLPAPLERVGTKDTFGLSGTMDELFDYFGLRAANIAQAARAAVERRS